MDLKKGKIYSTISEDVSYTIKHSDKTILLHRKADLTFTREVSRALKYAKW